MAHLLAAITSVIGLGGALLGLGAAAAVQPSAGGGLSATAGIPTGLVPIINRAASRYCQLPPELLAAVLAVESGFDNTAVSPAGAFTMAQFMPATWQHWRTDGDTPPDHINPGDPDDVITTAARYLCHLGAGNPDTQRLAIAAYNAGPTAVQRAGGIPHATSCPQGHPPDRRCETADYVRTVFAHAARYATARAATLNTGPLLERVLAFAFSKIGTPYKWGSDGRDGFYDCSGFTMRAYQHAGIHLPRTSRQQWHASPHLTGRSLLQPGDLLFWAYDTADPSTIHHVAIYLGTNSNGTPLMIDAPHTGATIQVRPVYWSGFIGATRPLSG